MCEDADRIAQLQAENKRLEAERVRLRMALNCVMGCTTWYDALQIAHDALGYEQPG